ncbi:MAG TPA: class F sortase [Microbacterium sp.]|uniref:class F sortase n=1 Tax=Microbacterium sp. TaxID=51671 RepID=UPI002B464ED4|nr:class F sortase [Microbacterium sp.]HKT55447.1 class F sortase [Microbacterium sp.]
MTLVAAAVLLVAGAVGVISTPASPAGAPVDLNGRPVQFDPGDLPSAQMRSRMHIVPDTGSRFAVPSVGLDVPLGSLDVVDDEIIPPDFTSAYLVHDLGVPPADAAHGSVFVVMHSLRGGAVGPGNFLIDVASGTSRVRTGARIQVADRTYTVTGWKAIGKTDVPSDRTLWANTPGRLVVITCLQNPAQTASVDNLVVFASLDG